MEAFEQNMATIRRSSKALRSRRATRVQSLTATVNTDAGFEEIHDVEADAADFGDDMTAE